MVNWWLVNFGIFLFFSNSIETKDPLDLIMTDYPCAKWYLLLRWLKVPVSWQCINHFWVSVIECSQSHDCLVQSRFFFYRLWSCSRNIAALKQQTNTHLSILAGSVSWVYCKILTTDIFFLMFSGTGQFLGRLQNFHFYSTTLTNR